MRLRRLGLSRYGMFTDHTIDFGERIGDGIVTLSALISIW